MRPLVSGFSVEVEKTGLQPESPRVEHSYLYNSALLTQPGLHDSPRGGFLNNIVNDNFQKVLFLLF